MSLRSSGWGAGHITHLCRLCWKAQETRGTPRPHLNCRKDTMSENLTPDTMRGVAQDLGASIAPPLSQSAEQDPECRRSSGRVLLSEEHHNEGECLGQNGPFSSVPLTLVIHELCIPWPPTFMSSLAPSLLPVVHYPSPWPVPQDRMVQAESWVKLTGY